MCKSHLNTDSLFDEIKLRLNFHIVAVTTNQRGNQLWGGAMPKQNVLRLLDIVTAIRRLNGIRGKRTNDVMSIRAAVVKFDERAYQRRIREGWRKRIAPLIEQARKRIDLRLPPETIRDMYWRQSLSAEDIGNHFHCNKTTILRQMERHLIPRRDEDDARRVHWRLPKGIQHPDQKSI